MKERLEAAFAAAFPEAQAPRVDRLREVHGGLWRFRVRWREPGGPGEADLALRIGDDPAGAAACQREARGLRLAAERAIPAPELWLASAGGETPAFVACEWVEGEPFSVAWRRRRRDATAETLAGLLVELHERTAERGAATAQGTIGDLISRLRRLAEEREDDEAEAEVEDLAQSRPRSTPAVLCHGDYRPEKVLLKASGEPWLVGWAHAGYGDPRLDVATTALWLDEQYGGALRAPFLRIYRQTRPVEPTDLEWFQRLVRLERKLTAAPAAT